MCYRINRNFKKLTPLKILMLEKNCTSQQCQQANTEHRHSEIERFSTLNEWKITQNSKHSVIVIVNKFSDML